MDRARSATAASSEEGIEEMILLGFLLLMLACIVVLINRDWPEEDFLFVFDEVDDGRSDD